MDRELVLMNVISRVLHNATHLLCRWHISKNVLVNCKKLFMMNKIWERFMMIWNLLVVSHRKILLSALGIIGKVI